MNLGKNVVLIIKMLAVNLCIVSKVFEQTGLRARSTQLGGELWGCRGRAVVELSEEIKKGNEWLCFSMPPHNSIAKIRTLNLNKH